MAAKTVWKRQHKIILGIVTGLLLILILIVSLTPEPEKSPKEKRAEQIEKSFSVLDGYHINLKKRVIETLNDPNSFEHIETKYWDRDSVIVVRMEFTAKNALGGRTRHHTLAHCTIEGEVIDIKEME